MSKQEKSFQELATVKLKRFNPLKTKTTFLNFYGGKQGKTRWNFNQDPRNREKTQKRT